MIDHYDLVQLLTAGDQPSADQARRLADFSVEMGWRPSDQLQLPAAAEFSTTHLIVEHGLENTAVITFLRHPYRHANLNSSQQKYLLTASYNNLVDWHINVDFEGVSFVYNRYSPPDFYVVRKPISRTDIAKLRSSTFQALAFQRLNAVDPACGSGIFLRVLLELQSETLFDGRTTESLRRLFDRVLGIDIDMNACNAAKLSLSLLSLVLTDELPESVRIVNADAIDYYLDHPEVRGLADAVLVNPPFVNLEQQSSVLKERVAQILGDYAQGRQDVYLAILKIALDLLKPDGFGLFVLPENFLKSKNASRMRALLSGTTWIAQERICSVVR